MAGAQLRHLEELSRQERSPTTPDEVREAVRQALLPWTFSA